MIRLSSRTKRGLAEAFGVPTLIGVCVLALLVLNQLFGGVS